jgi:hypothetical protein
VNFLRSFAETWWTRWQQAEKPQSLARYGELGIDYVVFAKAHELAGVTPVFANSEYVVYRTRTGAVTATLARPTGRIGRSGRELR